MNAYGDVTDDECVFKCFMHASNASFRTLATTVKCRWGCANNKVDDVVDNGDADEDDNDVRSRGQRVSTSRSIAVEMYILHSGFKSRGHRILTIRSIEYVIEILSE